MIREPWGGSEELWADMARIALEKKYTVIHSTFEFDKVAFKEQDLINKGLIHIKRRGFIKPGTPAFKRIPMKLLIRLKNLISNPFESVFRFSPDYVLYNGTCYSIADENMLLNILQKKKVPFGILGHFNRDDGTDINSKKASILKQVLQTATNAFFISQRSKNVTEQKINSSIENGIVVRNPVNMPSTEIVAFPKSNTVQFATVGNLRIIHKGQDIILDIFTQPQWKKRDWHLNIYGSGEDEFQLKEMAATLGLDDKVTFHGSVTDIRKLWANNHILLMPSRMEGMPLAIVEAMLCGRPSVVTDVGGHKEWIENGIEGWIAAKATVDSYSKALEEAWQQKDKWEQVGISAHDKAMKLYEPEPGKKLLDLILKSVQD